MAEDQPQEQPATGGEFEREPVPQRSLLGFKSFIGMYAGEHCAGTELMIGPLFVAAGVSAFDVVVGLLVGNALAVLSWMLLTAPIAVRTRLTLYYQLEKICGRGLVTLYNLANGVMFCFLAGSMITVSATALGVWFDFPMPALSDIAPNSVGWVIAVLALGVAISIVAAFGYEMVAKFANIAAPWMVLVFLAFGLVALREFIDATDTQVDSAAALWSLAETHIWRGGEPLPGQIKFSFWHVMFFAWFCNMAMHIGMSDLSVFRFAKKSWYGLATASGMYVGHFMAWLAAAMLFALMLHQTAPNTYTQALLADAPPGAAETGAAETGAAETGAGSSMTPELIRLALEQEATYKDADNPDNPRMQAFQQRLVDEGVIASLDEAKINQPDPLPGPLAYGACGVAGLICVIIAGWTTANPTIYRAGLAFQAIMPDVSRFKVTLATGMLATCAGMFPGIAMQLLGFVALYGLILMPMGAVIFADFWLFERLGLKSYYAEKAGIPFNLAAGLTWGLTLAVCLGLYFSEIEIGGVQPFQIWFVALPGWFLATGLYIVLSKLMQRNPEVA